MAFEIYPKIWLAVVVYLHTVPGKINEIKRICSQYQALIVEDKAESFFASYKGVETGTFEDVNVVRCNGNNLFETEVQEETL